MESLATIVVGIICIYMGLKHRKGDVSMLHSYHKKRVAEEDKVPFGKMVGLGVIIVGVGFVLSGGLHYAADTMQGEIYSLLANIALIAALVVGLGITFGAMLKYNKGIF